MLLGEKAAKQLKALRIFNNMGTEEFAKEIGVARQLLTRWETGKAVMTIKSFDDVCKRLNLDAEKFICGSPEIKLPPKP